MSAQIMAALRKFWQDSPLRGSLGIPASRLPPASRPAPPAAPSSAEHSARPAAADGRECDHDDPASPDPRACCLQPRGTGLAPLVPDSELCRRSTPFRCTDSTSLRSDACKLRRQARPALPQRREHGQFRCGYVRERDCAYAEPGRTHCRPQSWSAHRVESPGRSTWQRALTPALPVETTRRPAPDGRTVRPPRPVDGGGRLCDFSYGYDAHPCASGPSLKSRRLPPHWFGLV